MSTSADSPVALPPSRSFSTWLAAANLLAFGSPLRLRTSFKFFVRALGQPRLTDAWLARLIQSDIAPLWTAHPRLATKLQRPYVSCAWTSLERLGALMGHYAVLPQFFSSRSRSAIYSDGLNLMELVPVASGRRVGVRLVYRDQFEKEGELTLELHDTTTGLTLAGLTFCIAYNVGARVIVIGGIQASPDPRMRDLIHDLAKECHGLRPKALVLWCLQELASCWQVTQLQAVGDEQHIYRHRHKRREFAACYDEFWSESDGRRLGGGGWELPLSLRPRSREELKPSRRKAHERRYAMLAALRPDLQAAAQSFAPGGLNAGAVPAQPMQVVLASREAAPEPTAEAEPATLPSMAA